MKRRTKTLALVEVAVVLCSMLLVATLPAIATAASEDDFTLGIYGNANEDDTIDMRDTTYIKLAIFGKKPKTDLSDANYDGKVSMLDVGQTKLIILGKERELTVVDDRYVEGATATVTKPVERIVVSYWTRLETIRLLGAVDRVVGVGKQALDYPTAFPVLSEKPCVGSQKDLGIMEKLLELEPDTYLVSACSPELEDMCKDMGIAVVHAQPYEPETLRNAIMILGYILDERENAKDYFEWHDKCIEEIKEKVSGIPEDKRTRVFVEDPGGGTSERKVSRHLMTCTYAGGKNIAIDVAEKTVETEWIIEQNPDVIIAGFWEGDGGFDRAEAESLCKAQYDEIIRVPGFDQIKAVKDGRVHLNSVRLSMGPAVPCGTAYLAKWFYPELFEDLDPQAIHQDYIDRFCPGLDFDVRGDGAFAYPPME